MDAKQTEQALIKQGQRSRPTMRSSQTQIKQLSKWQDRKRSLKIHP